MIRRVIIESSNRKTVLNNPLSPPVQEGKLRQALSQHTILSFNVDTLGVAMIVIADRL